jgi:hypothetical protein
MGRKRIVTVQGRGWSEVGRALALEVSEKSSFAYKFDQVMYEDEPDIQELWKNNLAPTAEKSMSTLTPNAYELCKGFQTVFGGKGDAFSVWELLTLYEVDMFLHEFHYKCRHCKHRIMKSPRFVCSECMKFPEDASASERRTKEAKRKAEIASVCHACAVEFPKCAQCDSDLSSTDILHETSGTGIANKSGCTGFGYRDAESFFCGQTLEMATDTYNYGRFDTIYRLHNTETDIKVLVYDVGCILSPFGLNSNGLALCVFNLYNSDYCLPPYSETEQRVPMAAIQWELLLKGLDSVQEATVFLRGDHGGIPTFTSASFILAAAGDCAVIEVSANEHWVPLVDEEDTQPAAIKKGDLPGSKWIARANNCLAGSSLQETESLPPNISSKERQADLASSFEKLVATRPDIAWAKEALSTATIQTDYCLGTIVMSPATRELHVRFRVGTRISSTLKDGGKWEVFKI